MTLYREFTVDVAYNRHVVSLIYGTRVGNGISILIHDFTCNLRHGRDSHKEKHKYITKESFHLYIITQKNAVAKLYIDIKKNKKTFCFLIFFY